MAGVSLQSDNWLGNAINGLDFSGSRGAELALKEEQLRLTRLKAISEQQSIDQVKRTLEALDKETQTYGDTIVRPPPSYKDYPAPHTFDSPADMPANWPMTTVREPDDPMFDAKKANMMALRRLSLLRGTNALDTAKAANFLHGTGQVFLGGMPTDPNKQAELEFYTTGQIDQEKKAKPMNWSLPGSDQQGRTLDGKTDLATGTALPGRALVGGTPSFDKKDPFADKETALKELTQLAIKQREQGGVLDQTQTERAHILIERAFPMKTEHVEEGGRLTTRSVRDPIPADLGGIAGAVARYRQFQQQPQQPGGAPPAAAGQPGSPPPVAAPVPDTRSALEQFNTPVVVHQGAANPLTFMDKAMAAKEMVKYGNAIADYNTMIDAATNFDPTNATDLNIIYAIAKLFDPDSVVREGEMTLVRQTGNIPSQVMAAYNRLINDKGSLDGATRANLIEQGMVRMNQYNRAMLNRRGDFERLATSLGLGPEALPTPEKMLPYDRNAILARAGRAAATPGAAAAPPSPVAPAVEDVAKRLGFQ